MRISVSRPLNLIISTGLLCWFTGFSACEGLYRDTPEALSQRYCGSCHLPPDPAELPKTAWKERILPEMGARLGISTEGYDPFENTSMLEAFLVKQIGAYPEKPLISESHWEKLRSYFIENAPDSLPEASAFLAQHKRLSQFKPVPVSLDHDNRALITYLEFSKGGDLLIGDVFGTLQRWHIGKSPEVLHQLQTPLIAYFRKDDIEYVAQVGIMIPSEEIKGKLHIYKNGIESGQIDHLHRPVHIWAEDLNKDGSDEILVSEYGNYTGKLTLYSPKEGGYTQRNLYPKAGVVRVITADMNQDQKQDIVFLAAQGDEGVFILFQEENLEFRLEKKLGFSPIAGSSWFELEDYEGDGDLDIILAQGDNADFTPIPKPYHGIRFFINENLHFEEKLFLPIHGATRVVARDFDKDGDLDLAVTSFFPLEGNGSEASFIYLQNNNSQRFSFSPYFTQAAKNGRWMVMDAGDYDKDGDLDIALGSMLNAPIRSLKENINPSSTSPDFLILENQLIKNEVP